MIYLDNAATTPVLPDVMNKIMPYYLSDYYNPSAIYDVATRTYGYVEDARHDIADKIGCNSEEIYFTSGGSESNTWALLGTLKKGDHIITSQIEHHSILNTCQFLSQIGVEVSYAKVSPLGIVSVEEIKKLIKPNTKMISIMMVNNEIGTIQPIEEIGELAKKHNIIFHVDAVQAYGHLIIDVNKLHIDLLSASGHKLNAPKGIGFLFIRDNIDINPLIFGGKQEGGKRGGTLNVPGIIGLAEASNYHYQFLDIHNEKIKMVRDYLYEEILSEISDVSLNGDIENRVCSNLNLKFKGVDATQLVMLLSQDEIYCSMGSACNSGDAIPSHVLKAIGLSDTECSSSIRISIDNNTTIEMMDKVVDSLKKNVQFLRKNDFF